MNLLTKGIHGYLVIIGGIALVAVFWWANQYLFKNTTGETGWPLLVGAALLIVGLIVVIRRLVGSSGVSGVFDRPAGPYQWGSRKNRSDTDVDAPESSVRMTYYSEDKFSHRRDGLSPVQKRDHDDS